MDNTTINKIDEIQNSLKRNIMLRKMPEDQATIIIGIGSDSTFEQSREVVKSVCKQLDNIDANIAVRVKAYDNQDGWAPVLWIEKKGQEGLQMYSRVTPQKATQIINENLNNIIGGNA